MKNKKQKYIFFFGYQTFDGKYKSTIIEHVETDKNKIKDWITVFKRMFKIIK